MTDPAEQKNPVPAGKVSDRALVFFSRPARWIVAGGCLVVAELRILWDAPIDALSVGLLGAAVLLVFSRIKEVGWGGVTASFVERELAQVTGRVEQVEVPTETLKPSPPPAPKQLPAPVVVESGPAEILVEGHAPEVQVQAADQIALRESARATLSLTPPTNPTERLLWTTEQIRIELIVLAGNSGRLRQRVSWNGYRSAPIAYNLVENGVIPEELARITKVVGDARNQLVHGGLSPQALLQADTLALELLQKLREVKGQYIRVRDPDPALFRDRELTVPYEPVDAVMLATVNEQGETLNISVYPRSTEYQRGRFTSWEWDLNLGSDDEVFYRHPITGEGTVAWSESAMFMGREYPEEWGLKYRLPRPDAGLS
jgi:hypothetical protein